MSLPELVQTCFARGNFLFRMWDKFRAREISCALANKDRDEVPAMRNASPQIFRESVLV